MNKEEKYCSVIPFINKQHLNDKQIDNLSFLDIEEMLRKNELSLDSLFWMKEMKDWNHTVYSYYITNHVDIPEDLKKLFDFKKIICHVDSTELIFDFIKDDIETMPEEIPDECKKGKKQVIETVEMMMEYYKKYLI